jgi:predicted metal-dependent hydrolase
MGKRPKLNLNANHFLDSYEVEIQSVEKQAKLMKEFVKMQVSCEKQANQNLRESIEKSYRLIYEQMEGKFQTCESVEVADEVAKQRLKKYGVNSDQDAATA